jgi:hypothetical protein
MIGNNLPQVAGNFEIVEIDRRQFLRLAGGALIAISSLGLVGCGGSMGSARSVQGTSAVSGELQLPAGSKIGAGSLTAVNLMGSAPVSASGKFSTVVPSSGPSLVTVQNAAGKGVLFGFIDGSLPANAIGAQSSAVVLLYFAFGVYALPASVKGAVVAYLNEAAPTAIFAQTIAARVVINPTAIQDGDPQIGAAFLVAFEALGGKVSSANIPASSLAPIAKPASDPPLLLLQPSSPQSGFEVLQTENSNSIAGTNTFHRPAQMYIYKVGDVDMNGVETDLPLAEHFGSPIYVAGTTSLSVVSTIKNLFSGNTAFVPVTTTSITLPLDSGQSRTMYEIVVLFASSSQTKPAFYSYPRYAEAVPGWLIDQPNLSLNAFFSLFVDVIFEFMGVSDVAASEAQLNAIIAAAESIQDTAWQEIITAAKYGNFGAGIKDAVLMILDGAITSPSLIKALDQLIVLSNQRAAFLSNLLPSTGLKMASGAYAVVGVILGAADITESISNVTASDQGDLWTAAVVQPTIHLTPTTAAITPGVTSPTKFTVAPATGQTGTLVWDWVLTGAVAAQISDELGHEGTSIETSAESVYLQTTPVDIQPMTLTVEGFQVASGGAKTSIGTAKATVTIQANGPHSIVPTIKFVSVTYMGTPALAAFAVFTPINGASSIVEYVWTPPVAGQTTAGFSQSAIPTLPVLVPANFTATYSNDEFCYNWGGGQVGIYGGLVGYYTSNPPTGGYTLAQAEAYMSKAYANSGVITVLNN